MKKYVVVNNKRVKRVVLARDLGLIKLDSGDEIKIAGAKRVRRGDVYVEQNNSRFWVYTLIALAGVAVGAISLFL